MIIALEDRSKKRIWFAKKQLANIQEIDVPAKALIWDGFTFKVFQTKDSNGESDTSGGMITAPMGAVVLCSTTEGIKIVMAEYWLGGCTGYYDLYVLYSPNHVSIVSEATEEDLLALGYKTMRFKPMISSSIYRPPIGAPYYVDQYSCTPSITPYKGSESFNLTVTDHLFVDFNENGLPDFPYPLLDSSLTFYSSDGSNLGGRKTISLANGANDTWKTCQNLSDNSQTSFAEAYYDLIDNRFICASYISEVQDEITKRYEQSIKHVFLSDVVPVSSTPGTMPSVLRGYMLNTNISIIRPIGSYSFISSAGEKIFLTAAVFSPSAVPIGGTDNTIANHFITNPTEEKWRMFLSVTIGETVYLINSDQFYDTLQSLSVNSFIVSGHINWTKVQIMMLYLFPWPNLPGTLTYSAWKPHDSVMFHGHDDAVYTWTRAAGSVKFDATGMSAVSLSVPNEVTANEGIRPDISHAGDGLYVCVCNKVAEEISAVYYGSPFGPWEKLPDAPAYSTLVCVRPVSVDDTKIFLIGVALYDPPDADSEYRFIMLSFDYTEESEWKLLMKLPFPVEMLNSFSVGLFGNHPMVKKMIDYPSPPPANPQNIVVPYDGYAAYRP